QQVAGDGEIEAAKIPHPGGGGHQPPGKDAGHQPPPQPGAVDKAHQQQAGGTDDQRVDHGGDNVATAGGHQDGHPVGPQPADGGEQRAVAQGQGHGGQGHRRQQGKHQPRVQQVVQVQPRQQGGKQGDGGAPRQGGEGRVGTPLAPQPLRHGVEQDAADQAQG